MKKPKRLLGDVSCVPTNSNCSNKKSNNRDTGNLEIRYKSSSSRQVHVLQLNPKMSLGGIVTFLLTYGFGIFGLIATDHRA